MPEILIVEDTDSDAALLERALRTAGVANRISCLSKGADALAYLHTKQNASGEDKLAAIFIDLKLPDISGFEILKLMKGCAGFANVLRVVVSSLGDMDNIRKAYALGADSFIAKPTNQFDVKELICSFPEHWLLVDTAQPPTATATTQDSAYGEALRVWTENRETIQKVRETLEMLRRKINDNEETFRIIENLTQELRYNVGTSNVEPRKKPRGNLIL